MGSNCSSLFPVDPKLHEVSDGDMVGGFAAGSQFRTYTLFFLKLFGAIIRKRVVYFGHSYLLYVLYIYIF